MDTDVPFEEGSALRRGHDNERKGYDGEAAAILVTRSTLTPHSPPGG